MPPVVGDEGAEAIVFVVGEGEAGERLDRILAAQDLGYSRSTLQRFIDAGRVDVGGEVKPAKGKKKEYQFMFRLKVPWV